MADLGLVRPKMNTPSKAERISFWQHSYARASFIQTRLFIDLLLRVDPPTNDTFRRALTIAIVVAYCRPFKQREPVRLPKSLVPVQFRDAHDSTEEIRDKVIAHRDLDGPVTDWGFISQIQVIVQSKQITTPTINSIITNDKARDLIPLLDYLIEKMEEAQDAFAHRYLPPFVSTEASYVISLDDDPEQWLIPT